MQDLQGSCLLAVPIQHYLFTPPAGIGYPYQNTLLSIDLPAVLAISQY